MLWVTWRQHRGLLITILVAFVAAVVSMAICGLKIHHDYAMMRACRPAVSSACTGLGNYFNSTDWHLGNGIHVAVLAVPVLLAMFAGPLDGHQAGPARVRDHGRGARDHPAVRLVLHPVPDRGEADRVLPDSLRHARCLLRCLDADRVLLGAFLGMLVRRVLPAMAITLPIFAGLAALTWFCLRGHYPVRTFWPMQVFEAGWLLLLSAALFTATVQLVRRRAA
jgi:hypothetical protein